MVRTLMTNQRTQMAMVCIIISGLFLMGSLAHAALGEWYVAKKEIDNIPPGKRFVTIQAAINASSDGHTVFVYPGTYAEIINFNGKHIQLKSVEGLEHTIIDGSHATAADYKGKGIVIFENGEDESSVLSGFTITNGSTSGVYCLSSGPTLEYLRIVNNTAVSGGGIHCEKNARPIIQNTIISDNSADNRGGGIYCKSGSAPLLTNLEITNNSAFSGGGIACNASGPQLTNVTISDNSANQGTGIYAHGGSELGLKNTIIWNDDIFFDNDDNEIRNRMEVSYSDIQGSQEGIINSQYVAVTWGNGNMDADPLFSDPENQDYRLSDASPCIEAGTSANAPDTDIQGTPRPSPRSDKPDMGAYENQAQDIYVDAAFTGTETGGPAAPYITITQAIQNAPAGSTIHVARGTYPEALLVSNIDRLEIRGGWEGGTWKPSDPIDPNFTVIMANNSPAAIRVSQVSDLLIEGFTIVGDEVGVSIDTASDARIHSNIIRAESHEGGAGMQIENSSGHILRNIIHIVAMDPDASPGDGIILKSLVGDVFLENNIIYLQGNILRGIWEADANATPASLVSNEFYAVENAVLFQDANGQGSIRACGQLNNGTMEDIPNQGGNICNLLSLFAPCLPPPCADVVAIPPPQDTDGDGIPDNVEIHYFGDISSNGTGDTDGDTLTDLEEYVKGTDPTRRDTDGDAMDDAWEVGNSTNPLVNDAKSDPDNDGYSNIQEYEGHRDPNDPEQYPFVREDIITIEENHSVSIPVLSNDDGAALDIISVTQPSNGTVQIASGNILHYRPAEDFHGIDIFEYTVRNEKGHLGKADVTVYVMSAPLTEHALRFDGTDDYVVQDAVNNYPSAKMTLELWVRLSGKGEQTLLSYTGADSGNGFSLAIDAGSQFLVSVGGKRVSGGSVEDDNWHHVAVTWQRSDGKIKIFKDGYAMLSGTLARGESITSGGVLILGGSDTGSAFDGKMDDVRIWNDIRTQEEIQRDMNKPLSGEEEGLVAYWRLDEGSGQVAFDASGNMNHARLGSGYEADPHDPIFVTDSPLIPRVICVDAMFVNTTETGAGTKPYKRISKAIRVAPPGSTIRVAKGSYSENLTLSNIEGLKIEGGWNNFAGRWNRDDPVNPNLTAIIAMDKPVAVRMDAAPNTVLEGFTIFAMSIGVNVEHSDHAEVHHNIIHVPDGNMDLVGIRYVNAGGRAAHNRVYLSSRDISGYAMVLELLTGPLRIENNIFYMQGQDMSGILEIGTQATPAALLNNEFYGDENLRLYQDGNRRGIAKTCAQLNDDKLDDISERGGNICNLLPLFAPCPRPCADTVALPEVEDTDGDDIPDNWENYYFGDLSRDGTADQDGDGKTDLEEYRDETKPVSWDVKVTILPQGAADAGARWRADAEETWHDSGETVSLSGTHTLNFKAIPGWNTPVAQTVTPESGQIVSVMATYVLENYALDISAQGCEGRVNVYGEMHDLPWTGQFVSGETVTLEAIPQGNCKFLYWSGNVTDTASQVEVTMDSNKAVTLIFTDTAPHFPLPVSTPLHMDIQGNIYDAANNGIAEGDELAVFVDDGKGGLLVVGYALYSEHGYFVRVYGDDPDTPEKDGAAKGETLVLKSYSQSEGMTYTLRMVTGVSSWIQGTNTDCHWRYENIQRIPLHAGWNLFSFGVNKCYYVGTQPVCDMIEGIEYEQVNSIDDVLSSIKGQYSYIRAFDCTGAKTYNLTPWGNLKYMAAGYGYEIKINEDADVDENGLIHLELEGSLVSGKTAIPLEPGWNLAGYLGGTAYYVGAKAPAVAYPEDTRRCPIASGRIGDAFCSLEGQYAYVEGLDKTGAKSYNLTLWSNMRYVGPGYGYWIKIDEGEHPRLVWDSPCVECGD